MLLEEFWRSSSRIYEHGESFVAHDVSRLEMRREPKALAAQKKEWDKLCNAAHPDGKGKGTWSWEVREASEVRALSVRSRFDIRHMGCFSIVLSSSAPLAPIFTLFL